MPTGKLMSSPVTRPRWRRRVRGGILLALGLVVILVSGCPQVPVDAPPPSEAPGAPRPGGEASGSLRVLTWNVMAPALWEEWVEALGWWETPPVRRARELLASSQRLGGDLVAFQEVTSPFLRLVSSDPHWRNFNYGDGDQEQRLPHLSLLRDAWLTARPDPDDPGLTYDVERNPVARANAFAAEPSRRLDRMLLSSDLKPLAVGLVTPGSGQEAGRPPSDHYGVWVDISWPPSAAP